MIQQHDRYREMDGSLTAMIRVARRAADLAKRHNQPLVLWRDGRVLEIMPDELPDLPERTPQKSEQL